MYYKSKFFMFMVIVSLFLFLFPSIFSAHAYIKKSTPIENQMLEQAPKEITIQFDETVQPAFNSIKVFDSDGNRVDKKDGRIDPKQPSILKSGLKKNLPEGTYRIKWKVVSSDGHPVEGVIPFQIGTKDQGPAKIHKETTGYTPKADLIIIRWVQYLSNACYVGLLFFYMVILPKEYRKNGSTDKLFLRLLSSSLVLLFLSILLSLPLQATIESGFPWSEVFSFQTFENMLMNTNFGQAWIYQVAILLTLALITSFIGMAESTKRILLWVCLALATALLLTKALTSHAAAQANQLLTISMDFLHLLAASIWIGSLIGFVALFSWCKNEKTKQEYLQMMKGFSKWGIILVLLLTFTGVFGSLLYIPNPSSLIQTTYGKVLTSKVTLFLLMLILAGVNFIKGKGKKEKGLFASLWGELSIGVIILILSVVLTNLPTAIQSPGPYKETKTVQGNQVTLRVTPNTIGENLYELTLQDRQGEPIKDIEQLHLTFSMTEMDMGKETVNLKKVSDDRFEVQGLHFIMAGEWNVHVHILTKSLESIDTDFHVLVGSQ
ncbi:copper resistance protein CopC [Neobacillus sp. MM2021_6]|uniref:copper resistance protein CopC n=1 Tax=Bacillaceae TaxID=186817 RepID=UPI00140C41B2|nr:MULTISPECIES: copper resistance protein CopC [Bacillaceae]MBO0960426.1 copper resistance protein CopC [Neobacillus sp. MM2021_6]NHC16717.1 copper resistance protein CopC [Bacillus sp. MM2020_4]